MDNLPEELLYSIFTNLNLKDLDKVCLLDKRFRKFCFDNKIHLKIVRKFSNKFSNFVDKFTLEFLYLLKHNLFYEAYILVKFTDNIPIPPWNIFISNVIKNIPNQVLEIYMSRLPPILELFDCKNIHDFLEAFPIYIFNEPFKKYIKTKIFSQDKYIHTYINVKYCLLSWI